MRAVQVPHPGGPFQLVERPMPQPGPGEVRVKVQACGVCHSDAGSRNGGMAGQIYPVIPGHEIAGVIDALGPGVQGWTVGQRVGAGWFGGMCGRCDQCRLGRPMSCRDKRIHGVTRDGGYAEAVLVDQHALALIPDDLSAVEAAPMLCAGVTTFNALKRCELAPGAAVAVLGLGGLGHLCVQFAARMGCKVTAVARGEAKRAQALKLGASGYIDSTVQDVAAALQTGGGMDAIVATVTDADAVSAAIGGLKLDGTMMIVGVPGEPIQVHAWRLLYGASLRGSAGGVPADCEAAMAFAADRGVWPVVETLPLERAAEAYERMMAGEARLRMVLVTGL